MHSSLRCKHVALCICFIQESSGLKSALLQCRYPTLRLKLCIKYLSNPLQINFLATSTLGQIMFIWPFLCPCTSIQNVSSGLILDSMFSVIRFFTRVFRSNMTFSYTMHYLSEGGVSELLCDSGACRPWLTSVTLGVDYYLAKWEMFRVYSYIPPLPLCPY